MCVYQCLLTVGQLGVTTVKFSFLFPLTPHFLLLCFVPFCNCCFSGFMILSVNITEANFSSVFALSCLLLDVLFSKHFKQPLYWIFFQYGEAALTLTEQELSLWQLLFFKYYEFNWLHNMLYCALWSHFKCALYSPAIPLHRRSLSLFKSSTWMANQSCSLTLCILCTHLKKSIKQWG